MIYFMLKNILNKKNLPSTVKMYCTIFSSKQKIQFLKFFVAKVCLFSREMCLGIQSHVERRVTLKYKYNKKKKQKIQ